MLCFSSAHARDVRVAALAAARLPGLAFTAEIAKSVVDIGDFAGCLLHSYLENGRYSAALASEIFHYVINSIL